MQGNRPSMMGALGCAYMLVRLSRRCIAQPRRGMSMKSAKPPECGKFAGVRESKAALAVQPRHTGVDGEGDPPAYAGVGSHGRRGCFENHPSGSGG